jgi:hypothetical protein
MYRATSILTALLLVSSLSAGKTSFASEAASTGAMKSRISPSIETSQERDLLRQLAAALATGSQALSRFRGSTIKNKEGKESFNPLNPPIPGMDCSVDDIVNSVSCYSSAIGTKEEANASYGLSTNCKLFCRRIVGEEKRRSRESIRSEATLIRIKIPTPTSIST